MRTSHLVHCLCLHVGACVLSTSAVVVAQESASIDPLDWPNWRGPQQNRVSTEKQLIESWDPEGGEGSNLLWKSTEMAGRSSPIVLRGKIYTIVRDQPETENEGEKVVCADAATGEIVWQYRFNVYLSDVPDTRIGWSCLAGDPETGRIYCQGVSGYFCCLEGDTGKLVWDRSLHEEMGLISTYGGRTNVPFVFEDTVLVNAVVVGWGDEPKWGGLARPAHRYMGFDKATGELRWLNGTSISPFDTTYSTPTVMPIGGQQAVVFSSGDGEVWAIQPRTGKHIWHYPLSRAGINVSPLVAPNGRVYASHSEENMFGNSMGAVVALDGTKSGDLSGSELWMHLQVMAGKSSPVLYDGRLYVVDDRAALFIYDANSGKLIQRKKVGNVMRSTPLIADGKIYLCTNNGQWWILRPTERGVEEVHKLRLSGDESDGSPIVSHGRIYLPTSQAMYCLALPDQTPSADPIPPQPKEDPVTDKTPTVAQLIPYDILLKPGGEQSYRVRLFNARGQHLRDVPASEVQFAVDGPGAITPDGKYTAPTDVGHECALVMCKVGSLSGSSRVRITPPLPWNFDFNQAQNVPLTWIGGRVRWEVREGDGGDKYIAKKTVLPTPKDPKNKLGTRSFVWMGPIDLNNYTIQGDVLLTEVDGRISDVGLINSRYQLTIRGRNKKLRLDSWPPSDFRTQAEADFEPEPGAWYTLKLTVSAEADKAVCRGKIWKRDAAEPEDWTVEMTDHAPNLQGTPGVYGNTPDAEVYLDNVRVTPNS
ncbi:MAG TPA: PQQ-binding-like beta-propeller repeat protein [Lacipirellulaceae bacterium]|nr:PQQ-binding-like beta-propeller repeat protein [Lacipirellulaceae bacterium]